MIDEHAQCGPMRRRQDTTTGMAAWLCREDWGVVIDALIEHRGSATDRKAGNSASNSDARADDCARLIDALSNELATIRSVAPARAEIRTTVPVWR